MVMGEQDAVMSAPAKRSAPEGTPDRESQARAKMQLAEVVPQVLEVDDPVTKVEIYERRYHRSIASHVAGGDQPWNGRC